MLQEYLIILKTAGYTKFNNLKIKCQISKRQKIVASWIFL